MSVSPQTIFVANGLTAPYWVRLWLSTVMCSLVDEDLLDASCCFGGFVPGMRDLNIAGISLGAVRAGDLEFEGAFESPVGVVPKSVWYVGAVDKVLNKDS